MKDERIIFRLDSKLSEQLKKRAKKEKTTISQLVRDMVRYNLQGISPVAQKALTERHTQIMQWMQESSRIGGNLNQISYVLNESGKLDRDGLAKSHEELRKLFCETIKRMQGVGLEIRGALL
ncbi:ribbon-helix-helix protein, CopG family [Desulfovibrio gilichinskyi]|uniref:Ribbon-helix-helix protein, copG family n=1 Tax=Desulfovibrio gilichinskyi TaxID=1519643 RepID=A0A1X7E6T1_9BACT|nr:ribbon-helix-helix protein, CopG family [Desulfovibrio gilichinskyi]SMF28552.1 Ribbon-helix-helix protein, copG family [Desulfovibrio gilichinskyi]